MLILKQKPIKLAIAQSTIIQDQKETNLNKAIQLIDQCIEQGAKIVCLPEAFATGINWLSMREMAEQVPAGLIVSTLMKKASDANVYIVAGILEQDNNEIYDTAIMVGPEGALLGKYRRQFLWTGERDYIAPGHEGTCIQTDFGKIGLIVGYDINFPEACRNYFKEKVDIIICVAAVFEEFKLPTRLLVRSRATENHCYFVFASALGEHQFANKRFMGHSSIVCDSLFLVTHLKQEPRENIEILSEVEKQEGIVIHELFLDDLMKTRKTIPHYQDLEHYAAKEQL